MKCPYCHTDNRDDARYCAYCSLPLSGSGYLVPGAALQGRYLITRLVAAGGRGAVYQAQDNRLGNKYVAVKEVLESVLRDQQERADAIAQFSKEAGILSELTHDCLPRVSDFFEEKGRSYLVMDFIEGETLEHRLDTAGGPLPAQSVVEWGMQICEVLQYLHTRSRPIIFRDLKPGNIMVTADNQVKLIDFGIAKIFDPTKKADTISMGTYGYAPPEQFGSQATTDPRSDVYALGATLHHLLTARDPSKEKLFSFADAPAHKLNPKAPRQLSEVLTKATEFERSNRYNSADEMLAALAACLPALQPVKASPATPSGSSGPSTGTVVTAATALMLGGGAVVAAIVCLVIVLLFQNTGGATPVPPPPATIAPFISTPTEVRPSTKPAATAAPLRPTDTNLPRPTRTALASPSPVPTRARTNTPIPPPPTSAPISQAQLIVDSAVDFTLHVQISGAVSQFFNMGRGQQFFTVPYGSYSVTVSTDTCPAGATANITVDGRGNVVYIDPAGNACGYIVSWDH